MKEINTLKNHIEVLQKELEYTRKLNEANISHVVNSVESQMELFKERELFTVNQFMSLEDKFKHYRHEKERTITLMKEEIKNIKGHNLLLTRVKLDK